MDAEDLIARLSAGLAPVDRAAFRNAAMAALANVPECGWGEGSAYRTVTTVWRGFFHAPADREGRWRCWASGKKRQSRLISEGAKDYGRARRVRDAEDTGT